MSNAPAPNGSLVPIIGVDLDIRSGDAVWAGDDLGLVAGAAYAAQRFELIAKAQPGSVLFHPTFGLGLGDVVDEPFTDAAEQEVVARMAEAVAQEPYVAAVQDVTAQMQDNGTLQIVTTWLPVGGLTPLTTLTTVGGETIALS